MSRIYITGHRNPDTDSIASAIGYAELKRRLDPRNEYVPVRLGDCNRQTSWLLHRSGAAEPPLLPHINLRACDVMSTEFPVRRHDEPLREVGLALAQADLELVPIVADDGTLAGVLTERSLARRYVRDSLKTSTLEEAPTRVSAIVSMLEGELIAGEDSELNGRVWVYAMDTSSGSGIAPGDIVVVGNRPKALERVIELGAALVILSNNSRPSDAAVALAAEHGTALVVSPLDSYISGRMVTLAEPCSALMERDPLTVATDYLVDDIAEQIKDVHYGAAIAVDAGGRPVGLVTRSVLVAPQPRRVILVDHAEQAQSVPGINAAEIVEILDHHHIGSIETRVPVTATFDPVGSTATLVVERFRHAGMEPSAPTATMLLGAVMADTVILNSATTTDRDHAIVAYLERVLALDGAELGREMFERTADVSDLDAEQIISRDSKRYQIRGDQEIAIAQVEVVGEALSKRHQELLQALAAEREDKELAIYALMITNVIDKGTRMLVAGDVSAVARAFGVDATDSTIELPGVMSRKKEVAPKLMTAL